MSYSEDMAVFFQLGDPGVEEASHIDENNDEQPLIGEFITKSEEHSAGTRHINQSNPAFKLPEIHAVAVNVGQAFFINEQEFEIIEKLNVSNAICLLHLTRAKTGGAHRWQ